MERGEDICGVFSVFIHQKNLDSCVPSLQILVYVGHPLRDVLDELKNIYSEGKNVL